MKTLIWFLSIIPFIYSFSGCKHNDVIMKDSEIYKVELFYEKVIPYNSSFVIRVESKNISGKRIHKETCSTLYKLGATIEVYTIIDGKKFVLQDEFETITDDIIVETIEKDEILFHEWTFDGTLNATLHGTMLIGEDSFRYPAPQGTYNISLSTGELYESAFEIV